MSNNLRELRKKSGLTQAAVARLLGVEQATYQRWESGKRGVKINLLPRLARALGCSPSDIVSDVEAASLDYATAQQILATLAGALPRYPAAAPHLEAIFFRILEVLESLDGGSPSQQTIEALVKRELSLPPGAESSPKSGGHHRH